MSLKSLINKITQDIMFSDSSSSVMSPSAYDTAWLAMIPHPDCPGRPLFPQCLHWVLHGQRRGGFWGQTDHRGLPTLDCLTATVACLVALNTWDAAPPNFIEEGLDFLHSKAEELLAAQCCSCGELPRWFALVFTGMLELAESLGLDVFRGSFSQVVECVFEQRRRILEKEQDEAPILWDRRCNFQPLESHLEVLPAEFASVDCAEVVAVHQGGDGSLFGSPSATAFAFMCTGDEGCRSYLETMVTQASLGGVSRGAGVPAVYPVDQQLRKLLIVDTLEQLGIAEHFVEEIADTMRHVHSNWARQLEPAHYNDINRQGQGNNLALQLFKDALAFRLLRMHGYRVSPERFCWFLNDEATKQHIKKNSGYYLSAMLNVYRATHLSFPLEEELEEARIFSRKLLQKGALLSTNWGDGVVVYMDFQRQVETEMDHPWLARMEHLEHRRLIEETDSDALWVAKASFYRFPCPDKIDLLRLAAENFTVRQSTYRDELEEMVRWSKDWGLSNIGFGREKTSYIYFAAAVSSHLPLISETRKIMTKCAVLVTVADDFYDMEGEFDELLKLTKAVEKWEGRNLSGKSKVIFDALHGLVEDLVLKCIDCHGCDITEILRNIWRETFGSWLKEAEWSRSRHAPPVGEYMRVGMISIAIQAMILPACYLRSPWLPENTIEPHYAEITIYLMVLARLLNDVQSYEKEYLDGKLNMVMLLKNDDGLTLDIDNAVASVNRFLEVTKKEFLELALVEGLAGDIPKEWKQLHLQCLKVFQMFFNGANNFDSPTALLHSISMAIHDPVIVDYYPCKLEVEDAKDRVVENQEKEVATTHWFLHEGKESLPSKKLIGEDICA